MSKNHVFIIAEAGVNHNGDFNLALKLVDAAKNAGVDCVKFQTFISENEVSKFAKKADYQIANLSGNDDSQYNMIKKLELSFDQFREIKRYCDKKGIIFLSTPFDLDSVAFLDELGLPFWKIPSGEITNLPYLIKIARTGKDIVMSTGMSNLSEIEDAMNVLKENGAGNISLLHCNTEYPTPFHDVNLRAMKTMSDHFHINVGYSDHTLGIEVPIAAVAMGARIIEKHFTLDRNMEGPDHKASLEPEELKSMVLSIRNIEVAIGSSKKFPTNSEIKNLAIARKSIVAKSNIKKGETFTESNITTKRPGDGISPMEWFRVLGQTAKRNFAEDELIEL